MYKTFVLAVGVINMTTGKTNHKDARPEENWSIYEQKNFHAYLVDRGFLVLAASGTFVVGDTLELYGNDSQRNLGKGKLTIVDAAPTSKELLLSMLKRNNYDYYPIKAFRARSKGNRKLSTSYSVKYIGEEIA